MSASVASLAGMTLGRYQLVEKLGQGGMATVYRAQDLTLGRQVAVKVMHPFLAERAEAGGRFEREARAVAGLRHPNILQLHDYVAATADSPAYLVMELLTGPSLQRFLVEHGAPLGELAAMLGLRVAEALAAAHARGVVHRDVKPENVMFDGQRVVLCDFGIARVAEVDGMTATGAVLGSPAYMSPEQASSETVDARSDQFSLGSLLYQLATGTLPFVGATPLATMGRIVRGQHVPASAKNPRVPPYLERVIERCLRVAPADRFASADAVATALRDGLVADGLGDVDGELGAYLRDPAGYNRLAEERIVAAARRQGERARAAGETARALAAANRVLAWRPDDAGALRLLTVSRRRARWLPIAAAVSLAVTAAAGAAAWRAYGARSAPLAAGRQPSPASPGLAPAESATPLAAAARPAATAGLATPLPATTGAATAALATPSPSTAGPAASAGLATRSAATAGPAATADVATPSAAIAGPAASAGLATRSAATAGPAAGAGLATPSAATAGPAASAGVATRSAATAGPAASAGLATPSAAMAGSAANTGVATRSAATAGPAASAGVATRSTATVGPAAGAGLATPPTAAAGAPSSAGSLRAAEPLPSAAPPALVAQSAASTRPALRLASTGEPRGKRAAPHRAPPQPAPEEPTAASQPTAASGPPTDAPASAPPTATDAPSAAAPPAPAHLTVATAPWCDLRVDGAAHGRTPQTLALPAGHHHLECANPAGSLLRTDVDLQPGESRELKQRLYAPVHVTPAMLHADAFAVDDGPPAAGARDVAPGRRRVTFYQAGRALATRYLDVPPEGCRLVDAPQPACRRP